ncbi:Uncharacterised protein [Segatella copri]|nr:Uncharacterised protein [Segatella copri]
MLRQHPPFAADSQGRVGIQVPGSFRLWRCY